MGAPSPPPLSVARGAGVTRVLIGSVMAGLGYLLLYAGISQGGRYVLRPWDALSV